MGRIWRRLRRLTTTEHDYKERALVVDTYDAKSKQLIWRGSTEDALSDKPEKNEKNLVKGVEKMFKDFPPGSQKHQPVMKSD